MATFSTPNAVVFPNASPVNLLLFGQCVFVVYASSNKPKLSDGVISFRYIRAPNHDQYLVLLGEGKATRLIRPANFILTTPTDAFTATADPAPPAKPYAPAAKPRRLRDLIAAILDVAACDALRSPLQPIHSHPVAFPDPDGPAAPPGTAFVAICARARCAFAALIALTAHSAPADTTPQLAPPQNLAEAAALPDEEG